LPINFFSDSKLRTAAAEKAGDERREKDEGDGKKKGWRKGRAEAALSTRPGLYWSLQIPALVVRHVCPTWMCFTAYVRNAFRKLWKLKTKKKEREREGKEGETAERYAKLPEESNLGKRCVFMELILGRILLRSSNMKHETSKHFASVYASFHPGCKNICEFLWRGLSCTSSCRSFLLSFIFPSSHKILSGFLLLGSPHLPSSFPSQLDRDTLDRN